MNKSLILILGALAVAAYFIFGRKPSGSVTGTNTAGKPLGNTTTTNVFSSAPQVNSNGQIIQAGAAAFSSVLKLFQGTPAPAAQAVTGYAPGEFQALQSYYDTPGNGYNPTTYTALQDYYS